MRTPHAATISIALWLTRVAARPVSAAKRYSSVRALSSSGRDGVDSIKNANPDPKSQIYPKRSDSDAPYSLSEQELRSKIYFPETFSESPSKRPVILVPGTAAMAGSTYRSNLGHLLAASDFADPLWVNIPNASLNDAQENSEYVAYAMNYVQTRLGRKPAVVAWGQGNLNVQWALKYWPSTRDAVTDLVALSPGFHGTTEAFPGCKQIMPVIGGTPSVYQQMYNSKFVRTLRADGGDSAYVPTTSIFSATDGIVQPQSGSNSSAILNDAHGVEASSIEVQKACPDTPAGRNVTHEGVLYNSLAFALLRDALEKEGPGRLERIDNKVCGDHAAGQLSAAEVDATDAVLNNATMNCLLYSKKVGDEPDIKEYAKRRLARFAAQG
ncbi:alpha/beta-hydrolase [Colletotrichum falcatum]|nr:alpha/beta-hydrolase [Colletotrichum falcatum]